MGKVVAIGADDIDRTILIDSTNETFDGAIALSEGIANLCEQAIGDLGGEPSVTAARAAGAIADALAERLEIMKKRYVSRAKRQFARAQ